jgi:hypothetical protein
MALNFDSAALPWEIALMNSLSRRRLERLSYRRPREEISADVFGMLLAIICAAHGREMPSRDALTKLFLRRQDTPQRLKDALQFVERHEGPSLMTYTDMIDAAQQAGIIRRFNPGHISVATDIDQLNAQHLLQMANLEFNDEITWLEGVLAPDSKLEQTAD